MKNGNLERTAVSGEGGACAEPESADAPARACPASTAPGIAHGPESVSGLRWRGGKEETCRLY
ncbi:MAG: hypothetical protein ACLFOY_16335 [Desulfatibacillaceae bacterium]